MDDSTNRRRFLTAVGAGTFALAGCSDQIPGGDDGNGNGNGNGNESGDGNGTGDESGNETDGEGEQQVQPPAIDEGELVDDFEDLEDWAPIEGDVTGDTENALTGSQSARAENTGNVAGMFQAYPDGLDISGNHLSLALRVDTPRPARVTVRLLSPGQSDQLWSTRTVVSEYEGWLRMDVAYTGQRGEPNLENIQEIQISLDTAEEADIRFWVDDLRMTPQANQGYVVLTFDDGVASQYENVFPRLNERGMPGVAAVIPNSLNREGRLSIDQLREMRDAGWDVSSHPDPGAGLTEVDPQEARDVIESAHEYLDQRGFPDGARHMFAPYHDVNQEVIDITREYHELCSYFAGSPSIVPFTDPMHVSRIDMYNEQFTDMVDMAAQHNLVTVGLAHGVVPEEELSENPNADMTIEQLENLLDYIEESEVEVVNASHLIDNRGDL